MGRKKKEPAKREQVRLRIESIDLEGQGVAHHDGKVVFVQGAITGEEVVAEVVRVKPSYLKAQTIKVLSESSSRVKPKCPHFGLCGGCLMQHIEPATQVAVKARALEDLLERIGRHRPETLLPPLFGPTWGYRHRARLSARYVIKKEKMLVGFREKSSVYVADMSECHVLPKHVSDLLPKLQAFLPSLNHHERMPQIELAVGNGATALVLRHLEPLEPEDVERLIQFGRENQVDWWAQPKGPDTVYRLDHEAPDPLHYDIPSFGVTMKFRPTDFTQVNHRINDAMVHRAVQLLDLQPDDRVLDLFCGLGNFSLPLATRGAFVKGFEGSSDLVARASENAQLNGLADKTEFHERNLFELDVAEWESWGEHEKVLIDPPRDGAAAVVQAIAKASSQYQPERIVYVSCNPATLARDVNILCSVGEYRLVKAGVINMFPHTGHVESIALFQKKVG
ncbi:MAG: 23S rRNA (uracil(1939)-C(5))-methyltransferase RlmD [Limnobacter sp.]|nr:23S rRNA (uracil(1939)-C(5))-methyltransferase RlmD [Limnobacter sp.]